MLWIGLTGGLASGKSSVAKILQKKNIPVIGADDLAKAAVGLGSEGLRKVTALFGPEILMPSGELDRKKIAAKVFGQTSSLRALEGIIHPIVRQLTKEAKEKCIREGHKIAFYDVPLLFENNMEPQFDKTVVVATSEENQIKRAILRDQSNEKDVRSRMKHQTSLAEKMKRADFVIENNDSLKELEERVTALLAQLLN